MILVTGASSGIGEACVRAFAREGRGVILLARREARLKKLARELHGEFGVPAYAFAVDVSRRARVEAFFKTHRKLLSGVEVLVNNAGFARGLASFQEGSLEHWDEMIATNVQGLIYFTRLALPAMIKRGRGHVVNIGSVAGRWVYPKGNIYCATKHAVHAISQSLRVDLSGTGVRVSEINPGMVETEFSVVRLGDPKKAKAVYAGMTPLAAEDVAEAVRWCVSRPAHVNIQEVVLYPSDQASPQIVHRRGA